METTRYRQVRLKEVCDRITVGHVGPMVEHYVPEGIPFLRSLNIHPFKLAIDDVKFVAREFHEKLRKSALAPGDVAVVRTGYPGTACVIPPTLTEANCADLVVITPSKELNPYYLAAIFNSAWGRASVAGNLVGVAQQHFNVSVAREMEVPLPPRAAQDRVMEVLSAYEELIANNQRRIAVLEQMARALYREWFVYFRAPGVVMNEGEELPEGWEVKRLDAIADVIDCLHSKKPEAVENGSGIMLQLENISEGGKIDLSKKFLISDADYAKWISRMELSPGDCVITNVGRIGAVGQIPEGVRAAAGRNMTGVRCKPGKLTPTYLIQYLLSDHMVSEIAKKKDPGTIMDSLNVKGIVRLDVPCPPMPLMLRFESIVRPMRRTIEVLMDKNENLRRTRDLLLPRLMSGRVEVLNP